MTARKKRAPRPRPPKNGRPLSAPVAEAPAPQPEEPGVFVNRVTLDNTIPGGFRYEQVAVPQPARS